MGAKSYITVGNNKAIGLDENNNLCFFDLDTDNKIVVADYKDRNQAASYIAYAASQIKNW